MAKTWTFDLDDYRNIEIERQVLDMDYGPPAFSLAWVSGPGNELALWQSIENSYRNARSAFDVWVAQRPEWEDA